MNDYVILDLETTGLNAGLKLDEPVQIGLLDSSGNVLMDTLVKPTVEIDQEASATHGITAEMLEDAPTFLEVFQKLARLIEGKTVCIYNAAYDVRVLLNAAHNAGICLPRFEYECVMENYAAAWKQPNGKGYKAQKLVAAMEQQGFIPLPAHSAVADCYMTWMLKQHLDAGVNVKVFDPNAPMIVRLISVERKVTKSGHDYASFRCHDGQTLNVFFGEQFKMMVSKGWNIGMMIHGLTLGTKIELSVPIVCRVAPDGQYIKLVGVETENPHLATASQ